MTIDGTASETRILVSGVGGQGVVLCARLIAETALSLGRLALMSEVHGMSQRGGVVEATVVLGFEGSRTEIGQPASPMIGRRGADVLLATEVLEAVRALRSLSPQGIAVVFLGESPPPTVFAGGTLYPERAAMLEALRSNSGALWVLDPACSARLSTPVRANVAVVGAAIRAGALPFTLQSVTDVIARVVPSRFVENNIESLRFGYDEARLVN